MTLDARPRQAGRFCCRLVLFLTPTIGHRLAYVAVFLDIPQPTLYRWMQQGDLLHEDNGGLANRHISIADTMRVKAAECPGHPKKPDAELVRNRPADYELGGARTGG